MINPTLRLSHMVYQEGTRTERQYRDMRSKQKSKQSSKLCFLLHHSLTFGPVVATNEI